MLPQNEDSLQTVPLLRPRDTSSPLEKVEGIRRRFYSAQYCTCFVSAILDFALLIVIIMPKSILLTGLILGKETDMCPCLNINFRWLFERPSDLLWMDRIIVTRNEWTEIMKNGGDSDEGNVYAQQRAIKLIFERLHSEGLVQIVSDTIIGHTRAESILQTVSSDLELIKDLYKDSKAKNDSVLTMGQYHFCVPSLWSLYAAIELSRELNASFSLEEDELAYLLALIPRKFSMDIKSGRNIAMNEVLSLYLPSVQLGHEFLSANNDGQCNDCVHLSECKSSYLSEIEKQIDGILRLRQYDEIRMTCEIMDKICERSSKTGHVLTGEELWDDLQMEANETEKRIRRVLRKVKSWRKISTFVSIGLGAASFLNPVVGATAAIPAIAGQLLASTEERLKKEKSWVNFVNNPDSVVGRIV